MKILTAQQIRDWDQYTIKNEPIASIDLMERAARKCFDWLDENGYLSSRPFSVFCGKGNNGGDGLAIARMMAETGIRVSVSILEFGHLGTEDFQANLARLHQMPAVEIHFIQNEENFHALEGAVVIDALLGSGLTRPLDGLTARLVEHMNRSGAEIISIDIPSGLPADAPLDGNTCVKATHTLSFQCYKPAFMLAENADYFGSVHILDIGLHNDYLSIVTPAYEMTDEALAVSILKPRKEFTHKGHYGHAMIVAGSYGKMGAAVLAAKACLRSGVGLLTCYIPKCGYEIVQTAVPEAMTLTDLNESYILQMDPELSGYDAIGIGPGIGTNPDTRKAIRELFSKYQKPVVTDADALNGIAQDKKLLTSLPPGSILTPHPKEFERLFGENLPAGQALKNDFERIELAKQKAALLNCVIVLKGHHSFIATPGGMGYFNSTGNAGMATAGSGDVLTGILTGLLAQGYSPEHAVILGVYLHGLAGDLAAKEKSQEAMVAGDITDYLGPALITIAENTAR